MLFHNLVDDTIPLRDAESLSSAAGRLDGALEYAFLHSSACQSNRTHPGLKSLVTCPHSLSGPILYVLFTMAALKGPGAPKIYDGRRSAPPSPTTSFSLTSFRLGTPNRHCTRKME